MQGRGLRAELLRFVLLLARRMAADLGCVGVVVDAKAGAADFHAKFGFFEIEAVQGASEARPVPTLMSLSTRAIELALEE